MEHLKTLFPEAEEPFLEFLVQQYKKVNQNAISRVTEKLVEFGYPKKLSTNALLLAVLDIYPDMDLQFARDAVLKYNSIFRIVQLIRDYPRRTVGLISERDLFRPHEYIAACKIHLLNRYPYHWESTVDAVMAENNNDFQHCQSALNEMKPSYFWKTILPFTRRKEIKRKEMYHPLLAYELIGPQTDDGHVALELVRSDYIKEKQLIRCRCCFSDFVFEELNQCNHGHLFCKECITQQMTIGMYDTGLIRGKQLKCMCSESQCSAFIPDSVLQLVLPVDLYRNYQATLFEKSAQEAGINIHQCPFCNYFEEVAQRPRFDWIYGYFEKISRHAEELCNAIYLLAVFFILVFTPKGFESVYVLSLMFFGLKSLWEHHQLDFILLYKKSKLKLIFEQPKPLIFNCKNMTCLKVSCTACHQLWKPGHKCFEKEKDSLRTYVEMAMSQALIRTCPNCNIRFSKIDGCNKMECPYCKYVMCYICRQDIRKEKYNHFCQVSTF
jgi:hypothetical protein